MAPERDKVQRCRVQRVIHLNCINTSIMIDLNELKEALKCVEKEFNQYDRPSLTWRMKVLFAGLYNASNQFRYANGIDDPQYNLIDGDNEFIYDLIVVEEEKNETGIGGEDFITNVLLTLETELDGSFNEVVKDFQKLLISNSLEKAMVFKCHSNEFEEWVSHLKIHHKKNTRNNGRFYLIGRMNDTGKFEIVTIDE